MDRERFKKFFEILSTALSMNPAERPAYLLKACEEDEDLFRQVKSKLEWETGVESFLESPAFESVQIEAAGDTLTGKRIGEFILRKIISSGGMGTVYEAEQDHPKRTVAVKVMKRGMHSPALRRRFEYEAEVLARLRHQNIARVIKAGFFKTEEKREEPADSGLPYLVIEYVAKARDVIQYADDEKLSPRERLELFLQVCDAVEHGHQRSIIHRDLKPSNILVNYEGEVKVIDFGIAKTTDSDRALTSNLTEVGQLIGTLQYMSPEQCAQDASLLDIRSDVYSLGLVLFELLCDKRPYRVQGLDMLEAVRVIREKPPLKPGSLKKRLKGDIDTLLLKAIEKDPSDRYQSVSELSSDIRRYLRGEVILAKPVGSPTRFIKWTRRNPGISAVLCITLLFIAGFLGYMLFWAYPNLKKEQKREAEAKISALLAQEEAEALAKEAAEQLEEIKRLSDLKWLADLNGEIDALWPASPERIDALKKWLEEAEELADHFPFHQRTLEKLQSMALPYDEKARLRDRESHPDWKMLQHLKEIHEAFPVWMDKRGKKECGREYPPWLVKLEKEEYEAEKAAFSKGLASKPGSLEWRQALLGIQIAALEKRIARHRTWRFENRELKWRYDTLQHLIDGLNTLMNEKKGAVKDIRDRLLFAETIEKRSIVDHKEAWDQALASIADRELNPHYQGLRIKPQVGLVPIGQDPDSRLWEFGHLQTGELPKRDEAGKLLLHDEVGLVFVLIPVGTSDLGDMPPLKSDSQKQPDVDPAAGRSEKPLVSAVETPFFISKFEMTQGQWLRFVGKNQSSYRPGQSLGGKDITLLNPVETISWDDCIEVMYRMNLRLPTNPEWEYATRGGTTTSWWTGDDKKTLKGAANLADSFCKNNGGPPSIDFELWLNDGYVVHAPVGRFRANPFGLHDVCGNVSEWCQNTRTMERRNSTPDGSADEKGRFSNRDYRGGNFAHNALGCRSANINSVGSDYRRMSIGVRPVADVR